MRTFIVDGHPTTRLGLRTLLRAAGIRIVGESGDGDEALSCAEAARPDLVILGLNLVGGKDGVTVCREMKFLSDAPYVLVHAADNPAEDVLSCFLAGADSYVHKASDTATLLDAVRRTGAGERMWLPGEGVGEPRSSLRATPGGSTLTPREREVLALMLRRYSNAEVAEALHISLQTAKNHASKVLKKLGVRSRKQLFPGSPVSTI